MGLVKPVEEPYKKMDKTKTNMDALREIMKITNLAKCLVGNSWEVHTGESQ